MYISQLDAFALKEDPWVRLLIKINRSHQDGLVLSGHTNASLLMELNITSTQFDKAIEYLHAHDLIERDTTNLFKLTDIGKEVASQLDNHKTTSKKSQFQSSPLLFPLLLLLLVPLFFYFGYTILSFIAVLLSVSLFIYAKIRLKDKN